VGNLSVATGINDDGLIVGYAQTGDGTVPGVHTPAPPP
jgi:probable HAF family extracellular repeat protein